MGYIHHIAKSNVVILWRKRRIVGARTLVIYTQALVMNEMSVHPRVSFVSVSVIKSVHKFSLQLGLVWSNPNSRGA